MKKKYRIVKRIENCEKRYYIQYKRRFKWIDTSISYIFLDSAKKEIDRYREVENMVKEEIIDY